MRQPQGSDAIFGLCGTWLQRKLNFVQRVQRIGGAIRSRLRLHTAGLRLPLIAAEALE
jgi:hypothetical protein